MFFSPLADACVFSAGMPLPIVDQHGAPAQFFLRITVSVERDRLARQALAEGLQRCLQAQYPNAFLYLHFDAIQPEQVFYSAGSTLINAGTPQGTTAS
ncbi:hypothetical protein D3C80_1620720 [compost metagenome]